MTVTPAAAAATPGEDHDEATFSRLVSLLRGRRLVALTGAGCSTESGIPDYRSPGRVAHTPIQHDAFMKRPDVRRRYWARASLGWDRFRAAQPNAAHHALAALERGGVLAGVITQNVDRLHHAAGSQRVVELHGALHDVHCIGCGAWEARDEVQARLLASNPGWPGAEDALQRPDGDAELGSEAILGFRLVGCRACGGALKPGVVFFGGSVAEETVADAFALLDEAEALLVVGSSLTVYSGFRFVRRARERALPVAVLNIGPTRADDVVDVKWTVQLGTGLPRLAAALLV